MCFCELLRNRFADLVPEIVKPKVERPPDLGVPIRLWPESPVHLSAHTLVEPIFAHAFESNGSKLAPQLVMVSLFARAPGRPCKPLAHRPDTLTELDLRGRLRVNFWLGPPENRSYISQAIGTVDLQGEPRQEKHTRGLAQVFSRCRQLPVCRRVSRKPGTHFCASECQVRSPSIGAPKVSQTSATCGQRSPRRRRRHLPSGLRARTPGQQHRCV